MTLAAGRTYLAIPGPSVIPDRVLRAMHRAAPNIYTGELVEMVPRLLGDLNAVARSSGEVAIYIANGHGAWEAAVANVVAPGDRVLVLATGRFAGGWGRVAERLGAEITTLDFGRRAPVDIGRLAEALAADRGHRIRAVMAVQVDTATGVLNDVAAIRQALDAAGHPALLLIDAIACLGCDRLEMDAWGVDVMVSASQKGLMTPPGLGIVWFNGKAAAARAALPSVSPYWDWAPRADPDGFYEYFCGTAPTHHLYGLREALDMIGEEGIEAVWARHRRLARAIWAAFEAWGTGGPVELNIPDAAHRSTAVTAARVGAPHGTRLREWVEARAGVTLGIGLGMADPADPEWHGYFRLGHMGHVNAHMVLGALAAIQSGLTAVGVPFGPGGLDAAAEIVAGA
jgi:alanine-glyoxylate transaminase/serine-glyoxylate transaminase/serine-pyruvate transaminase